MTLQNFTLRSGIMAQFDREWLRTHACPKSRQRRESCKPQKCVPISNAIHTSQMMPKQPVSKSSLLQRYDLFPPKRCSSFVGVSLELGVPRFHTIPRHATQLASSPRRDILTGADGVGYKLGLGGGNGNGNAAQCDANCGIRSALVLN